MKREDHCTHPDQKWCDCDWCRFLNARKKALIADFLPLLTNNPSDPDSGALADATALAEQQLEDEK